MNLDTLSSLRRVTGCMSLFLALDWQRRHPNLAMVADVPSYYGIEVERMYLYPPVKAAAA